MISAGHKLAACVQGFVVAALANREGPMMDGFIEEPDGRSTATADLRDNSDPSKTYNLTCNWPARGAEPVSVYVTANTAGTTTEYRYNVSPGFRKTDEDTVAAWEANGDNLRTIEASMKVTPKIGPEEWDASREQVLPLSEAAVAELVTDMRRPEVQPFYR